MTTTYSAIRLAALLGDAQPTRQQAAAIEAEPAPLLIIAGAGSGKTTTMAARVVWLIANGHARADQILGLTFTRKAAGELARKIRRQIARLAAQPDAPPPAAEPTVSTYHSYASGIVTEHGPRAGVEPGGTVLSAARAWQLAYATVSGYDGDMSAVTVGFDEVVHRTLSLSDELAEHLRTGDELRRFTEELSDEITARVGKGTQKTQELQRKLRFRLQLLPLVAEYTRRKRDLGVLDYADQLALAARVADAAPEVGRLERRRYPIVLLDEYQDTSHSQVRLLRDLFGGGHPVTAVGDPCQSIYAWRGASAGTLDRFATEFPDATGEPAARVSLSTSWRNRAGVLTVANAVSEPLRTSGLPVDALEPGVDGDGEVIAAVLETIDDEAGWVADRIADRWSRAGTAPTTAVLVRRRSQIPRLEEALRAKGLPVEVVGLGGLLDAPEVREVYATLTVLARPTSGPALLRLLTGVRWRIGPRDIAALHHRARDLAPQRRGWEPSAEGLSEVTIAEALDDLGDPEQYSAAGYQRFTQLRDELAGLRIRGDQPAADLISEIVRVSGLDIEVAVHGHDPQRLDAFTDIASQYWEASAMPSLDGFLSYLEAAEERERGLELTGASERGGTVQIMTVHAAKGLEWDLVAVPGLCKGVFPGKPRDTNWLTSTGKLPYPLRGDAMELPALDLSSVDSSAKLSGEIGRFAAELSARHEIEERRLAYVALTRARFTALVSGYWWDANAAGPRGPSGFLHDMRDANATVDEWADEPDTTDNPLLADELRAEWPVAEPLGAQQEAITAAAAAVRESDGTAPDTPTAGRWADEATLLLAERRAGAPGGEVAVPVPAQLSVSQLVGWHRDAQEFASRLRRPVPEAPAPHTRRGTAFHAWLEQRFGSDALFDLDDLPGAADTDVADDESLRELCDAFERSPWADRTPVAVEVPFTTVLRGTVLRGRMDAVFALPGGRFEVVDWKTGRPPYGRAADAAAVQLAAYRQAWAALRGIPVHQVSAAFHYVPDNRTVRPDDLPDLAGLAAPITGDETDPLPHNGSGSDTSQG